MPYNSQAFGLIISRERINRGMTQKELSSMIGISRSHLAALESGKKKPNIETFWTIAVALSIKPSQLLAMIEDYSCAL